MSAITSVNSPILHQTPPAAPLPSVKIDRDGDTDNSSPSETASAEKSRALSVTA